MTDLLLRDAEALHHALAEPGGEVKVALSRETAELVSRLVEAPVRGEEIVVTAGTAEVNPTEAAVLLGMSRPQVRKLMDRGLLECRKVGTHHRIRVSSIRAFQESERVGQAVPVVAHALSYLASAVTIGLIRPDPMWRDVATGLRYVWDQRVPTGQPTR